MKSEWHKVQMTGRSAEGTLDCSGHPHRALLFIPRKREPVAALKRRRNQSDHPVSSLSQMQLDLLSPNECPPGNSGAQ